MWFLEHESLFGGKRIWLRPGTQQLFGRTKSSDGDKAEGKQVFIDNKNVSRKHLMIRVLAAPPEDGTKLHARSQVEITDLSCRQGTIIDDGAHILKSSKAVDGSIDYKKTILTGSKHTIKLSNSYPAFTISWQDFVFTHASKENERTKARNAALDAIDIKTSTDFVQGKTSHVVSQKRNLPKVLLGLVSGISIVSPAFLDAVLDAATSSVNEEDNYIPSQLEENFDVWWPKEAEHVPPAGAEPVARPETMLLPNSARSEVYTGLTFVFLDPIQYSNLHQVIAGGGGKALLYDLRINETTIGEYVDYVKSVAGQKRSSSNHDALPVVTIRAALPEEANEWATAFVTGVDRALNQRSILQNEFLDAIVTKDASSLQRPPSEQFDLQSSIPLVSSQAPSHRAVSGIRSADPSQRSDAGGMEAEPAASSIPRKRPVRRGLISRFAGFDDYEPPKHVPKSEQSPMEDIQESGPVREVDSQTIPTAASQRADRRSTRADRMAELFPAAAEIKKQRAATRGPSESVEPDAQAIKQSPNSKASGLVEQLQKSKQKVDKEINVREEARKRVKVEEDRRLAVEESLREALEGVDISTIRAAIQIEEMALRRSTPNAAARTEGRNGRWDPAWEGRKNFKKFRRRDDNSPTPAHKVFVPFEAVSQKKRFGESFFLEDAAPSRTQEDVRSLKRRAGRDARSESEAEGGFARRKRQKQAEVINVEDSEGEAEEADGTAQTASGRTQRVAETQLEGSRPHRETRKRSPAGAASGEPSSKRSRVVARDTDSDDEETGFRFRRRG